MRFLKLKDLLHANSKRLGFSLIEVLIALTIISFIMLLIGGSIVRQLQAKEKVEQFNERLHTVRSSMLRISREISMAYLSKHYNCNERRTHTLFKSKSGSSDELTMTTLSHYKWVQNADESDQNEISYYVKKDPNNTQQYALFRKEYPRITEEPSKLGKEFILAHNIKEIHFEFYQEDTELWQKDWDTTRSEQRFKLPTFVKIKLVVPWVDDKPKEFVTQTKIMLQEALSFGPINPCPN